MAAGVLVFWSVAGSARAQSDFSRQLDDCAALLETVTHELELGGSVSDDTWTNAESMCGALSEQVPETEQTELYAFAVSRWALLRVERRGDCAGALHDLGRIAHRVDALSPDAQVWFGRAAHAALACPPPPAEPTHGAVAISPGDGPMTLRGMSHGSVDASMRFGGSCIGLVGALPSHTIQVGEEMTVGIVAFADYDADLTLVVTGPQGTLCNDDFYGFDPALSEVLAPGSYAVYVGEFSPTPTGTPYQLQVSEGPLRRAPLGGTPSGETLLHAPGQPAQVVTGTSGGPVSARVFGPGCEGSVAEAPNHRIEVMSEGRLSLEATPVHEADLTLVLVGTDESTCNDDFDGFNPAISRWVRPATYDVYIGDHHGAAAEYALRVSDDNLFAVEPGRVTPLFGAVTVAPAETRTAAGVASGLQFAADRFGPACTGYISWEPNHILYLDAPADVFIAAGSDTGDLTLIVAGASEVYCNDDSLGRDPGLELSLEAGTYDVYVGQFTPALGTPYGLRVTTHDPGRPVDPSNQTSVLGDETRTASAWGQTAGDEPAANLFGDSCPGYIPYAPTHTVTLGEEGRLTATARSSLEGDLVLVVEGADAVFCDDDSEDRNPRVSEILPAGTYGLYVGEFMPTGGTTPFALELSFEPTRDLLPEPPTTAPTPVVPETVTVTDIGPAPVGYTGTSGGIGRARHYGPSCVGYLPEQPSFSVDVSEAGVYEVAIQAEGDTTLVMTGPGGPFCNDDSIGFNPVLTPYLEPGQYEVYVGSYNPSLSHVFEITFRAVTTAP